MIYAFAFDTEFCSLLWSQNPTDLDMAFCTALRVQEFIAIEKEHNSRSLACYKVSNDEEDEDDSCLDDHEPIVASL